MQSDISCHGGWKAPCAAYLLILLPLVILSQRLATALVGVKIPVVNHSLAAIMECAPHLNVRDSLQ